jgi:hypothetical protein
MEIVRHRLPREGSVNDLVSRRLEFEVARVLQLQAENGQGLERVRGVIDQILDQVMDGMSLRGSP